MLNRAAVKRAGKVAIGLPMALAIWRSAEVHCARCCGDSSAACSIDLTRIGEGRLEEGRFGHFGKASLALLVDRDSRRCI